MIDVCVSLFVCVSVYVSLCVRMCVCYESAGRRVGED
jgi:hypothetical protein